MEITTENSHPTPALTFEGTLRSFMPLCIHDQSNEELFVIITEREGKPVSEYRLYGKVVSTEEVLEFFIKNKPT